MLWLYILLLIFAGILAVVWIRYGLKEKDMFVLGAGLLQVGLGILWILLILFAI